jgi:hypothetical protein
MRMRMQKMPGPGLCLPTSFAMALEISVETFLLNQLTGWYLPIFPGLPEPLCWRGIHIQECIRVAQNWGYAVTPRELFPQIAPPRPNAPDGRPYENHVVAYHGESHSATCDNWQVFSDVILLSRGVITGVKSVPGVGVVGHAVAYDHGYVYDPNDLEYPFSQENCEKHRFYAQCAWRVDRIL